VAKHLSASNELENHVQIAMVLKRREKERGEITA
jgi:hydroxypyruvate isomerase